MAPHPLDESVVRNLVRRALCAPSADNDHPFIWEWDGDRRLVLMGDSQFDQSSEARRFLAAYAVGALSENLVLASAELGWRASPSFADRPGTGELCAWTFSPESAVPDGLARVIESRHTNRKLYRRQFIEPALLEAGRAQARSIAGVRLEYFEGAERSPLLTLMRIAETERFSTPELHAEIFASVRFDVGWKSSCSKGIPPIATEVEPPARPMFGLLRHWPVMRFAARVGGAAALGARVAWLPGWASGAIGVITCGSAGMLDAVACGRALQRVWLQATLDGLALQPLAASPLLALPFWPGVREPTRQRLLAGWREVPLSGTPLMLFRLGRAAAPSGVAGRPSEPALQIRSRPIEGVGLPYGN